VDRHAGGSLLPQLVALDQGLVGDASTQTLRRFLAGVAARQRDFFLTPAGSQLVSLKKGCDCGVAGAHFHDPGDPRFKPADTGAASPEDDAGAAEGPRIRFEPDHVFASPILRGGRATATFTFSNVGTAELKIGRIETGCSCTTLGEVTRGVPPGGAGVIEVHYDSKGRTTLDDQKHVIILWVDSNSVGKADPLAGHEIRMTVPFKDPD
jgi:hypothetical protein